MTDQTLVIANWKDHAAPAGWDDDTSPYVSENDEVQVVVCPKDEDLEACIQKEMIVGAQWGRRKKYTMSHYSELGCTYVLCGHSDRRTKEGETDVMIGEQVEEALNAGLIPILCVGETDKERANGMEREVVERQLEQFVPYAIIAYEPVWAIGTGKVATAEDVADMHAFIHDLLPDAHILYGGSVKAANAKELISVPHVGGLLVGGASLDPEEFRLIVQAAAER